MKNNFVTTGANAATSLAISIIGLTKKYGESFALKSVSLDVQAGEFLTLLGPSGSGKTTLLMAIAGFNRPNAGSIRFGGNEMILTPPHRREVGMVFQNYALFPHMSVFENVAFPLKLRKVQLQERRSRAMAALETVQLSQYAERQIDQLSGGQRQRVALARAFVFRPRILLMDEPLSALDKKLREQMQIELKQLHRQLGVTTVYVTHDQREALTMSDRIAVINHGEITQIGTPKQIYNAPVNEFVADFIGESSVLPLDCDSAGNLAFSDQIISMPAPNQSQDAWSLLIRPERLTLVKSESGVPADSLVFHGVISEFVFQGDTALALLQLQGSYSLSIRFNTKSTESIEHIEIGQRISLSLNKKDIILIPRVN
jgi:putative spermidine/putrescine transport system ATP-binding protein